LIGASLRSGSTGIAAAEFPLDVRPRKYINTEKARHGINAHYNADQETVDTVEEKKVIKYPKERKETQCLLSRPNACVSIAQWLQREETGMETK